MVTEIENSRFIPIDEWNKHHNYPSQRGLKLILHNLESLGFSDAFHITPEKTYINEEKFDKALRNLNKNRIP